MSVRLAFECPASGTHPPLESIDAEAPHELPAAIPCASGGPQHLLHREHVTSDGGLLGCLACGHPELYTQKDFPRNAGLAIVVVAALLAPFTYYLSLFAAAAIDAVLYWFGPEVVTCYVCGANHHRFPRVPRHPRFDREIDERLKFGAKAVMGKPMRVGGTAGAPEPEH